MKYFLTMMLVTLIAACNSGTDQTNAADSNAAAADTVATTPAPEINLPFTATLADDWVIGKKENVAIVMQLYQSLQRNDAVDAPLHLFADSITSVSFDDRVFRGPTLQFLKNVKTFRNGFRSLDDEFITWVSLHSPSKDLDVVAIWVREKGVRINGKADSTLYQENWHFNKEGKIDRRTSFARYHF